MNEDLKYHTHDGINSPKIYPRDLNGFPVYSSVPTHDAPEGTIVAYWDGSTTYKIYIRLNKSWKSVAVS